MLAVIPADLAAAQVVDFQRKYTKDAPRFVLHQAAFDRDPTDSEPGVWRPASNARYGVRVYILVSPLPLPGSQPFIATFAAAVSNANAMHPESPFLCADPAQDDVSILAVKTQNEVPRVVTVLPSWTVPERLPATAGDSGL